MATKKVMTKSQLINHVATVGGLKKTAAKEILENLVETAGKEVKKNGQFVVPGLGKLVLAKRKARMGRNPQTGEAIKIPARTVLKFRIAKALKDSVLPKR
ncbi:MAG: HU family DNA-binding protein [Acidobacteria bacterium]|nr:HU family DNA-binding protein [Acidobacteriota bacterium]